MSIIITNIVSSNSSSTNSTRPVNAILSIVEDGNRALTISAKYNLKCVELHSRGRTTEECNNVQHTNAIRVHYSVAVQQMISLPLRYNFIIIFCSG